MVTPDRTSESRPHPDALLAQLDAAREAAALLVVARARWEAEASRQRAAAEALAEGTRDLVAHVRQAEAEAQRLAAERQELAERLRRAEAAAAYEAMRTDRLDRSALGPEATRDELWQGAGTQFDPEVVEAMLRALDTPNALRRARHDALGDAPPPGPS